MALEESEMAVDRDKRPCELPAGTLHAGHAGFLNEAILSVAACNVVTPCKAAPFDGDEGSL